MSEPRTTPGKTGGHVHSFGPRGRGQCSCGIIPGEPSEMWPLRQAEARIRTLEAHRNQWRRRAWRLEDVLREVTSKPSENLLSLIREVLDDETRADERKKIVAWLETIPPEIIDDWGLNAIGNIIDILSSGEPLPTFAGSGRAW